MLKILCYLIKAFNKSNFLLLFYSIPIVTYLSGKMLIHNFFIVTLLFIICFSLFDILEELKKQHKIVVNNNIDIVTPNKEPLLDQPISAN